MVVSSSLYLIAAFNWVLSSLNVVRISGKANATLPRLGLETTQEAFHHEVEPEDVHAEEHDEEDCKHNHHVFVNAHSVPGVHLLEDAADHVGGEEPKADVEPGHNHANVSNYFYGGRCDVDGELEDAAS